MREFAIITDSCCDLPIDLANRLGIIDVPMGISIDNKLYKDWLDRREISTKEYYEMIRDGVIGTTSAANIIDVMNAMKTEIESGRDVLYISFSSEMSCSYQSANVAKRSLLEDFPDARIEIIDSKSASIGQACLLYFAAWKRYEGKSLDEVVAWLKNNCTKVRHYFIVEDLEHLKRTGRISALSGVVGGVLGIRPLLGVNNEGKLLSIGKLRGRKHAIRALAEKTVQNCYNNMAIFIVHVDCYDDAVELKRMISEKIKDANIFICDAGFVIGNNVGAETLAVGFLSDGREEIQKSE
jgi:DegV family protein with EDD domain